MFNDKRFISFLYSTASSAAILETTFSITYCLAFFGLNFSKYAWLMWYSISNKVCCFTADFNWHSHTVITRQPIFFNSALSRSSRCLLRPIFFCQYPLLECGICPSTSCPCQKHPWMKITMPYLRNTISGVPGNPFTFLR